MSAELHASSDQGRDRSTGDSAVATAGDKFPPFPLFLIGLLLIALAIRLPRMGESLWFDELWSTHVLIDSLLQLCAVWVYDCHPPLHSALMFFWIKLFGDSEFSVRLPSLICGLASIVLAYHLAERWWGRTSARRTAILMCFAPAHIWYSCEARLYALTVLLVLAWTLAFDGLVVHGMTRGRKAAYVLVAFLAVATHYFNAFFLVTFAVAAWRFHPHLRRFVLAAHSFCAIFLAAFIAGKYFLGTLLTQADHLHAFDPAEAYRLYSSWLVTGNVFEAWAMKGARSGLLHSLIPVVHVGLFLLGILGVWNIVRKSAPSVSWLCVSFVFGLPGALLVLNYLSFSAIYIERSVLVVLPFYGMAVAGGLQAVCPPRYASWATTVLAAFMIVTFLVSVRTDDRRTVYEPKSDWRAAAQYLGAHSDRAQKRQVFVAKPAKELIYYLPQAAEVGGWSAMSHARREQFEKLLAPLPLVQAYFHREALRIVDQAERRVADATVHVREVTAEEFRTFLDDSASTQCTIIRNAYWLGSIEEFMAAVRERSDWEMREVARFKGLEVLECRK